MPTPTTSAAPVRVEGARILLVAARYYVDVVDALIAGATRAVEAAGGTVEVIDVPGAFETPAAIALASMTDRYDGYVALGCVVRGETSHYDYVCSESARGLMDLSVRDGLAIGYGILTVENMAQAVERADPASRDKGGEAARACLAILALMQRFADET
jgi:6,7-dimethyl-8-ribityllumazine synthase